MHEPCGQSQSDLHIAAGHSLAVQVSSLVWGKMCVSGRVACTDQRRLVLQQTQTATHTTVLLTLLTHTPSLQFTPLLPTTTPIPAPLGRPSVGEMAVMVSLDLLDHQDLQGYLVPREHTVWRQSTYVNQLYVQPPTTDTPTNVTPHTATPPPPVTTDLHPLGEDLLPSSRRD